MLIQQSYRDLLTVTYIFRRIFWDEHKQTNKHITWQHLYVYTNISLVPFHDQEDQKCSILSHPETQ